MNVLGVGPMELIMVFVLALIVIGPAKLPEVAGQLGRAINEFRRASQELQEAFSAQLAEETAAQAAQDGNQETTSGEAEPTDGHAWEPAASVDGNGYAEVETLTNTAVVAQADDLDWLSTFDPPSAALLASSATVHRDDVAWLRTFEAAGLPGYAEENVRGTESVASEFTADDQTSFEGGLPVGDPLSSDTADSAPSSSVEESDQPAMVSAAEVSRHDAETADALPAQSDVPASYSATAVPEPSTPATSSADEERAVSLAGVESDGEQEPPPMVEPRSAALESSDRLSSGDILFNGVPEGGPSSGSTRAEDTPTDTPTDTPIEPDAVLPSLASADLSAEPGDDAPPGSEEDTPAPAEHSLADSTAADPPLLEPHLSQSQRPKTELPRPAPEGERIASPREV